MFENGFPKTIFSKVILALVQIWIFESTCNNMNSISNEISANVLSFFVYHLIVDML